METLSIIIPVHREPYLNKTVDSLLDSCVTDVEILVVFDGHSEVVPLGDDPRVKPITIERSGMRGAINAGLAEAKGTFVMKCDAHCLFAKGFDKVLIDSCKKDWLIIPRRYGLDEATLKIDKKRPKRDYHYLSFPNSTEKSYGKSLLCVDWYFSNDIELDNTMSFQGSCWLANREYFMEHIGFLDDGPEAYGTFIQECLEIGMKYWLGGGAIKVNKKTWYAHLSKRGRHYSKRIFSRKFKKDAQAIKSYTWAAKHWMNDLELGMKYSFAWFIDKFSPVPTWDENWKEIWSKM